MKHLVTLAVMAAALAFGAPSYATSYSTDQSDLWFIPAESGWGIQFVQRGSTIFATMFVYDASGNPTWFVSTMAPTSPGSLVWTGALYTTHGTYFGQPYNAASFGGGVVGNMTWAPQNVAQGMLNYSVNGVAVSKNIMRQPLANENYSGRFAGGVHTERTACFSSANNGTLEQAGVAAISQNGAAISFSLATPAETCVYAGNLSQGGQLGDVPGTYTCTGGDHGTMELFDMQVTQSAISGRFVATSAVAGCHGSGWFGGARTTLF